MSFHITVSTVIQTAMTKGGTDKISTPPTWSYNHGFSSNFFNYHLILIYLRASNMFSKFFLVKKNLLPDVEIFTIL